MSVYFTADPHYGHSKLVARANSQGLVMGMGLRPLTWPTVEDMDNAILEACNSLVGPSDTLYILGDFAFAPPAPYRARIKCRDVRLIWGNHDKPSMGTLFKYTWDVHQVMIRDTECWLSHYPHMIWPASHYGSMHLYGHLHGQREEYFDSIWPDRRSMDIGIDNVMRMFGTPRPLSGDEVYEILMARKGHDPVEFYRDPEAAVPEQDRMATVGGMMYPMSPVVVE